MTQFQNNPLANQVPAAAPQDADRKRGNRRRIGVFSRGIPSSRVRFNDRGPFAGSLAQLQAQARGEQPEPEQPQTDAVSEAISALIHQALQTQGAVSGNTVQGNQGFDGTGTRVSRRRGGPVLPGQIADVHAGEQVVVNPAGETTVLNKTQAAELDRRLASRQRRRGRRFAAQDRAVNVLNENLSGALPAPGAVEQLTDVFSGERAGFEFVGDDAIPSVRRAVIEENLRRMSTPPPRFDIQAQQDAADERAIEAQARLRDSAGTGRRRASRDEINRRREAAGAPSLEDVAARRDEVNELLRSRSQERRLRRRLGMSPREFERFKAMGAERQRELDARDREAVLAAELENRRIVGEAVGNAARNETDPTGAVAAAAGALGGGPNALGAPQGLAVEETTDGVQQIPAAVQRNRLQDAPVASQRDTPSRRRGRQRNADLNRIADDLRNPKGHGDRRAPLSREDAGDLAFEMLTKVQQLPRTERREAAARLMRQIDAAGRDGTFDVFHNIRGELSDILERLSKGQDIRDRDLQRLAAFAGRERER